MGRIEFFKEYSEANRYQILEVIGKGSYGVVCSAIDTHTGEKVAIKKINDIFDHVSDATRILREIKLLRFLKHPDIVEIKHILLPPSPRDFKDIYVVFELMEADLHQVIKANDDLTQDHYQFFLYQLLRALKFIHTANVFHRDLKPKNVLANSDCKLKLCDFGLARVAFSGSSSAIFWTDYVATRWYRAPELCGSFYSKYTTAVDMWSVGCIFAEVLSGRPLFPGRNVVNQLELITDLLGTPPGDVIARIRNDKARRYLTNMRRKQPASFHQKFPNVNPLAVRLLQKLLAFDAKDRPTAEEALGDPYFKGLAKLEREPASHPAYKADFDFERKRLNKEDVRELIYREILEYHPEMLKQYLNSKDQSRFMYPSAVDQLKRQFDHLQRQSKESVRLPMERKHTSLPRERVLAPREEAKSHVKENGNVVRCTVQRNTEARAPLGLHKVAHGNCEKGEPKKLKKALVPVACEGDDSACKETSNVKKLVKSASVSLSQQTQPQPKTRTVYKGDQDTNKKESKVGEGKIVQTRNRSMGSTVAKLVAVFSNGMAY
ncbi:hypothetical protein GOP47_0001753 [Adiantum capillus-veneris]|uniref:mitogen-activated protein kinase n=1 Tax=Adiantum capillus-veneris TaxID=13818 RepID=A0A9D4V9M4_ADICA|nr:hypothetical protein GOP47_0001753 [Adiantum capillus-veneris]